MDLTRYMILDFAKIVPGGIKISDDRIRLKFRGSYCLIEREFAMAGSTFSYEFHAGGRLYHHGSTSSIEFLAYDDKAQNNEAMEFTIWEDLLNYFRPNKHHHS